MMGYNNLKTADERGKTAMPRNAVSGTNLSFVSSTTTAELASISSD